MKKTKDVLTVKRSADNLYNDYLQKSPSYEQYTQLNSLYEMNQYNNANKYINFKNQLQVSNNFDYNVQ